MNSLTRRRFVQHLALLCFAQNYNAFADDAPDNQVLIDTLRGFLRQSLIGNVISCVGGVVESDAVEAFRKRLLQLQWRGVEVIQSYLQDAMADDIDNDRTVFVDGWVIVRTEALVAASYSLLTEERHFVAAQHAVEEW